MFAEEAAEHEADAWASDSDDEAGPSDQEAEEGEEEEEGTAQAADEPGRQGRIPLPEDEVPSTKPPPGRRRHASPPLKFTDMPRAHTNSPCSNLQLFTFLQ